MQYPNGELASPCLQNNTLLLLLLLLLGNQRSSGGGLEHLSDTLAGSGGTLQVVLGADLVGNVLTLCRSDRLLLVSLQVLDGDRVVSQVDLASNQNHRNTLAEMQHLGDPLLQDVVQGVWGVDGETDQDHVGVWVRQWSQSVVIFLTGSIPKGQLDFSSVDLDVGDVVLKDGGDVHFWEGALGEDDQKTGLTTGTVSDNDQFSTDFCWRRSHSEVSIYAEEQERLDGTRGQLVATTGSRDGQKLFNWPRTWIQK